MKVNGGERKKKPEIQDRQTDRDKKHWGYKTERRKKKLRTQYSETEFV